MGLGRNQREFLKILDKKKKIHFVDIRHIWSNKNVALASIKSLSCFYLFKINNDGTIEKTTDKPLLSEIEANM